MPLDSKHPLYSEFVEDWTTMTDCYQGERVVKAATRYLPATSGMIADGYPTPNTIGAKAYEAYRTRAVYHDFVKEAVRALVGMMHHKPPTIELPAAMEAMREKASTDGEGLEMLLRKINAAQLTTGRLGLLLDLPETPTLDQVTPYVAIYAAKSIMNWDNGRRDDQALHRLNFVALDESEFEMDKSFEWTRVDKYRILVLGDPAENEKEGQKATYRVGVFREKDANFDRESLTEPTLRGRKLEEIPFVFVNASDVVPSPDEPPLMGLARLCLAIYRGEADYRQSLFMQSQDTLVVTGDQPDVDGNPKRYRTGANACISLPQGGTAEFIGVESQGLAEQREAVNKDKQDAATLAGQLMDSTARGVESGEALQMRVSARTATLNEIAITGAFALQTSLRQAAVWLNQDPEKVVVTPNLDFVEEVMEGKSLVEYMSAKMLGAPLSLESIHATMQERGLTKLTFEEELERIANEEPLVTLPAEEDEDAGGDS